MAYVPEFAELINQALARLDRSPSWLAQRIDVNPSTVSRWLNQGNRPGDPEIVVRIADVLGMTSQLQALLSAASYGYVATEEPASPQNYTQPSVPLFPTSAPRPSAHLPNPATNFVGREREIDEILSQLRESGCRLLTLLGQGGMGKTRLAIESAERFYADGEAAFDGVFFTALENLSRPEQIPGAIASSLGLPASGADPQRLLLYHLADKRLLLVLDNWEHLLEGAGLVSQILDAAPQVKVLATSRERLNLQEEWLFPVGGLDLPEAPVNPIAQAQASGAVQLFLQSARRVHAGRDFSADLPCIVQLCQLVAGAPLALELAAHWLRMLSCSQIVAQLQADLDLLATPLRNVPERQRSMRAVFDYSWQLADEKARAILCQVAVFAGGFDLPGFQAVARGSVMELAALVDASWVQASKGGRCSLHPLVRSYLQEKLDQEYAALAGEDSQAVAHRHSDYFSQLASDPTTSLLLREINNLIAGWQHAIQHLDIDGLRRYVEPMAISGAGLQWPMSLEQTDDLLAESVERVRQQDGKHTTSPAKSNFPLLEAILLTARLNLARRTGKLVEADKLATEALALLETVDDDPLSSILRFRVLVVTSNVMSCRGQHAEVSQLINRLASLTKDSYQHMWVTSSRGTEAMEMGSYDVAEVHLNESLRVAGNWGPALYAHHHFQGHNAIQKGAAKDAFAHLSQAQMVLPESTHIQQLEIALFQADYELLVGNGSAAYAVLHRTLPEYRAYGYTLSLVRALISYGQACLRMDLFDEAENIFNEAYDLAKEMPYVRVMAEALHGLSAVALGRQQLQVAEAYARQALALVWPCGLLPLALESLVSLSETRIQTGAPQSARHWLRVAVAHPATAYLVRVRAQKLLESLGTDDGPVDVSDPQAALAEIVTGLLSADGQA